MLYSEKDKKRLKTEDQADINLGRTPFRRDYGRLLHSPVFRRLQGKTQLFPGDESDFFRNRLTHSLEVAQIAKGISLMLNAREVFFKNNPIDTDLAELAGLAHDLGHPPFGHNGEKALDDCMKAFGGFEGNAQTLRLLARTEKKVFNDEGNCCGISNDGHDNRLGLNFTFRSLASILKYDNVIPKRRNSEAKLVKGYYATEKPIVDKIKKHVGQAEQKFKVLECQIMDLADDIAYSTYDLEDSMKGGFSHPLALRTKIGTDKGLVDKIHQKVKESVYDATIEEVFESLNSLFNLGPDQDLEPSLQPLQAYNESKLLASQGKLRIGFTSTLVDKYIKAIRVDFNPDIKFSRVYLERDIQIEVESLKHLNYYFMIMSPRLKVVEYRGYDLVKTIFTALSRQGGNLLLPEDYQEMYDRFSTETDRMRLLCDFVAGMTDRYAIEFYSRLMGAGASIYKPL